MEKQQYRPTLLDAPVSIFTDAYRTFPEGITTLRRIVSTKFYRQSIELIRSEADLNRQKELKAKLRAFSPVALLQHRKKDVELEAKIASQWPMLTGDIDQKDNPGVNMAELKNHLGRLPYLLLCAYSVRGGLWFVVRLPDQQTPDSLAAHFRYLKKLFSDKFGIILDSSKGGNPTALRYVSYDEEPFINENATVMSGTYTPDVRPIHQFKKSFDPVDGNTLLSRVIRFAQMAGDGERHERLLKAATVAGGYIVTGALDELTVVQAFETLASEWPMFEKSRKTIRDGIRYGLQKPLDIDTPTSELWVSASSSSSSLSSLPKQREGYVNRTIVSTVAAWVENKGTTLKPDETDIERFPQLAADEPSPASWDEPSPLGAVPMISAKSFHEWQQQHQYFNTLGLPS